MLGIVCTSDEWKIWGWGETQRCTANLCRSGRARTSDGRVPGMSWLFLSAGLQLPQPLSSPFVFLLILPVAMQQFFFSNFCPHPLFWCYKSSTTLRTSFKVFFFFFWANKSGLFEYNSGVLRTSYCSQPYSWTEGNYTNFFWFIGRITWDDVGTSFSSITVIK